jgi:hypothetical protein
MALGVGGVGLVLAAGCAEPAPAPGGGEAPGGVTAPRAEPVLPPAQDPAEPQPGRRLPVLVEPEPGTVPAAEPARQEPVAEPAPEPEPVDPKETEWDCPACGRG